MLQKVAGQRPRPRFSAVSAEESLAPELIAAYPTQNDAAQILGVDRSRLSRIAGMPRIQRGAEYRLRPTTVMDLARFYKRRSVHQVAGAVLDLAYERAPEIADLVDEELQAASGVETTPVDAAAFLGEAKRTLPPDLYARVEAAYWTPSGRPAPDGREPASRTE